GDIDLHRLLAFHRGKGGTATVTAVPLRSQYGTVVFDDGRRVAQFVEKPVIREHWINAGFFVFSRRVFDLCDGHNLEVDVLPRLASRGVLFTHLHDGFWKSMDTSKDQQELEQLYRSGAPPWVRQNDRSVQGRAASFAVAARQDLAANSIQ